MEYTRLCNGPLWPIELDELKRQSPKAGRLRRPFRRHDGAHYRFNGDSYPCTVIAVSAAGHKVTVVDDRTRAPGLFEPLTDKQIAEAEASGRRVVRVFTRRKDGSYRNGPKGMWLLCHGRAARWNREF